MKTRLLLAIILLLAAFLRLWQLGNYPPSLNRDEAALAYNALLIKEAGVDEWGRAFPLQFQSFGDYKLGGYVYFLVAIFTVIPLSDWAVRTPAALSGIVLVLLVFLVVRKLFPKLLVAQLWSAFGVSLAPVMIFYSRMAWEAMVGLTLMMAGVLCFLHVRKSQNWYPLFLGTLFFLLSILTYNAPLILLPGLAIVLAVWQLPSFKKSVITVVTLGLLCLVGVAIFSQVAAQKSGITLFTHPTVLAEYPAYRNSFTGAWQTVLGNQYLYYFTQLAQRYLETFSPQFLITEGGEHPWHSILGRGHLYWSIYLLAAVGFFHGLVIVVKRLKHKNQRLAKPYLFLILTVLFSPLPSVITYDAPHATRSLLTMVLIVIWSGIGLQFLMEKIKQQKVLLFGIGCVLLLETVSYLHQYFIIWPAQGFASELQVGLRHISSEIPVNIPVSVVDGSGYTYISLVWYQRLEPQLFLSSIRRSGPDVAGLYYIEEVGQFQFTRQIYSRRPQLFWIDNSWKLNK